MTVDEGKMLCTASPLVDPSCPGFADALAELLASVADLQPGDPFYDEWVQANLDQVVEEDQYEDEEDTDLPEEQKANFEKDIFAGKNTIEGLVESTKQDAIISQLAQLPKIEPYYQKQIYGGVYEETLTLIDTTIPDNSRALRSLSSDLTHNKMVRSQYE